MIKNDTHFDIQTALSEELPLQALHVQGVIPNWLKGTLVRNGPVQISVDGKQNRHWFDGLAMLHAFSIADGVVKYTNKYLRTEAYEKVFEEGALDYLGFATDPCRSIFKKFITLFSSHVVHNANINVAKLAQDYVALTEVPLPVRFDIHTLETLGVFDYQDRLPKDHCWESAHPHYDPVKKETINYLIKYGHRNYYIIYRLKDGSATREIIAEVPVEEPAYMHSFAVTENYIILTEFPFCVRSLHLLMRGKPFIDNFQWKPERDTQFLVIDRETGKVLGEYPVFPFFAFHHVNAFERETDLIIDIVTYPDASVISKIKDHANLSANDSRKQENFDIRLSRFTLSLPEGTISCQTILEGSFELPRFNDKVCEGKPYKYAYGVDLRESHEAGDMRPLYKVNVETGEISIWSCQGCYAGEPIFVPSPNAKEEDEGVILAILFDEKKKKSCLLVLNAKSFQEVARAEVSHEIPQGLHGRFF